MVKLIKGQIAKLLAKAISEKVDMYDVGIDLDARLDKFIGIKASEKIQRTDMRDALRQFMDGLYYDDLAEFAHYLQAWQLDIVEDMGHVKPKEVIKKELEEDKDVNFSKDV